ncbi:MAG: curli-like amyloid fiber formation chaperone CsgH [Hyphomonadaceae bacterium]|nr:curli-like amyloid fiber formation chaperone CsgH [Hyphomonadaceae bacterium]
MSRTLMAVLAVTAAAACAAAATTPAAQSPTESQIVGQVTDRLADASATMAISPSANAATAQYDAPAERSAPTPIASSAAMTCEIRATPTADGVRLESFAHASGPLTGTYDLIVTKSGSAGSSDINQGGDFDTLSEPSASLGMSEISLEPGARLHARLIVHGDNGVECRDEIRS